MRTKAERFSVPVFAACLVIILSSFSLPAKDSSTGRLKLMVKPHPAGVFVDGKYLGPATTFGWPIWYELTAGEHEITLSEPRYQDFTTKVNIAAGKTTTLSHSLQPATLAHPPYGTLRVEGGSTKYDAVYLNGKFMGHVDEFNNSHQGLMTAPGEYNLKVASLAGSTELEQKIKLEENKTTHLVVGAGK